MVNNEIIHGVPKKNAIAPLPNKWMLGVIHFVQVRGW